MVQYPAPLLGSGVLPGSQVAADWGSDLVAVTCMVTSTRAHVLSHLVLGMKGGTQPGPTGTNHVVWLLCNSTAVSRDSCRFLD